MSGYFLNLSTGCCPVCSAPCAGCCCTQPQIVSLEIGSASGSKIGYTDTSPNFPLNTCPTTESSTPSFYTSMDITSSISGSVTSSMTTSDDGGTYTSTCSASWVSNGNTIYDSITIGPWPSDTATATGFSDTIGVAYSASVSGNNVEGSYGCSSTADLVGGSGLYPLDTTYFLWLGAISGANGSFPGGDVTDEPSGCTDEGQDLLQVEYNCECSLQFEPIPEPSCSSDEDSITSTFTWIIGSASGSVPTDATHHTCTGSITITAAITLSDEYTTDMLKDDVSSSLTYTPTDTVNAEASMDLSTDETSYSISRAMWQLQYAKPESGYIKIWYAAIFTPDGGAPVTGSTYTFEWSGTPATTCDTMNEQNGDSGTIDETYCPSNGTVTLLVYKWSTQRGYEPPDDGTNCCYANSGITNAYGGLPT